MIDTIQNKDCLEGMRELEANSVDLIATDPPYQLSSPKDKDPKKGFMGKEWDVLPTVDILKECLRVLKPGAFSFWLMTPRQDSQLEFLLRLREAGFVISFSSLYWVYSSGFPKATNISKAIDKKLGFERAVIGTKPNPKYKMDMHYPKDDGGWLKKAEFPIEGGAVSERAKALEGAYAGFQPKPATEIIVVAMKPLSKPTYLAQALDNGHGITFLGNCRIPFSSAKDLAEYDFNRRGLAERSTLAVGDKTTEEKVYDGGWTKPDEVGNMPEGRFAANILVSDKALDTGQVTKGGVFPQKRGSSAYFGLGDAENRNEFVGQLQDEGGFSRYFSLDLWWQDKIKRLPEEVRKTFPFLIVSKASSSERDEGCEDLDLQEKFGAMNTNHGTGPRKDGKDNPEVRNIHPTTKPTALMAYLVALGSRKGEVVLDPFVGSGTTCVACRLSGRHFLAFELNPDYHKIAMARISDLMSQKTLGDF